jgi:1-deoxy-D-xylulose-5-phosphate reductoisomerase
MEAATDGPGPGHGPIRVALLGSGGSIGRQAVDVLTRHSDMFRVVALATGTQAALLEEQARVLRPAAVSLAGGSQGRHAAGLDLPKGTDLVAGPDALEELATRPDVDLVLVATGGLVALRSVLAALTAGKIVATANKETLVAGGHLVMPLARALAERTAAATGNPRDAMASPLGWLRPIDSEHSAIWQCRVGESRAGVERLWLTASGGPFLNSTVADLETVTPERALKHPTWTMGSKITIDSATLANKGLEIIEARWLYDVPLAAISVVVHPQSVVHSAVQFADGSIKAQLGTPDMRLPIQFALTYPERLPSQAAAVDLVAVGRLEFRAPDEVRFPALRIAREAGLSGPRASAALISADEVAVARFLGGTLSFQGIPRLLGASVERFGPGDAAEPSLAELIALNAEVRSFAESYR